MFRHWNSIYGYTQSAPWFEGFHNNTVIRKFEAYFVFVGWWAFSLGLHISIINPNIEIHLPFGFIRVGFTRWVYNKETQEIHN